MEPFMSSFSSLFFMTCIRKLFLRVITILSGQLAMFLDISILLEIRCTHNLQHKAGGVEQR